MRSTTEVRIPVTLLTGFLGSGKTTILNHLVRQPELADALVIINEFGTMALDHQLVTHSTEAPVMQLSSGCLCCSIRSDLVKTLHDISWRFARHGQRLFSRVLIETTGLADPAPIINTLASAPRLAARYQLDAIVTVIDQAAGPEYLDRHPEAINQAAVADLLLLTKADLASARQQSALQQRLDSINQTAVRLPVSNGVVPAQRLLSLNPFSTHCATADVRRWPGGTSGNGCASHTTTEPGASRHTPGIRAFCFTIDQPVSPQQLTAWLEQLAASPCHDILRIKGIFNIEGAGTPMVIHGVQHLIHPPQPLPAWPGPERRSRLVFITRNLGPDALESILRPLPQARPATGRQP